MNHRLSNKWGLPRKVYLTLAYHHNRRFTPPFNFDDPDTCRFGSHYWHQYPVRDYDYQYNSWGFRDQDYEQLMGTEVNICVGDSNTVNVGGPAQHSWPAQLAQYFDIPTLNLGVDDLGCFDVPALIERARGAFRVRHIFILYNLLTDDQEPIKEPVLTRSHNHNIGHKVSAFRRWALVAGAHFQFDPPWTFSPQDLQVLRQEFPQAHEFLTVADLGWHRVRLEHLLVNADLACKYHELQGPDWPRYAEFCQRLITGEDMTRAFQLRADQRLISQYLRVDVRPVVQRLILANRDGWHLSEYANGLLAQYFRQQVLSAC